MIFLKKTYPNNFKNLIYSRTVRNIADSFYSVAITIGLFSVYAIDSSKITLFTIIGIIPNLFSIVYAPLLNLMKRVKLALIITQFVQIIITFLIIVTLKLELNIFVIYLLNLLFNFTTNILNNLQMRLVPVVLDNDPKLIANSVDIQYFASNFIDIISNFISSLLLTIISYQILLTFSVPVFLGATYFTSKLIISNLKHSKDGVESQLGTQDEHSGVGHYSQIISDFKSSKVTAMIIIIESILSGGTDLLIMLLPIYLIREKFPITFLGIVFAVQRAGDLLGAFIAPKIKINPKLFFSIDYMFSGSCFILLFLTPSPSIKLILFFLVFFTIGISGNIFEKMIYTDYDVTKLNSVYSVNATLFSIFGTISLFIPFIYDDIYILGIVINTVTVLFGIMLIIYSKKRT